MPSQTRWPCRGTHRSICEIAKSWYYWNCPSVARCIRFSPAVPQLRPAGSGGQGSLRRTHSYPSRQRTLSSSFRCCLCWAAWIFFSAACFFRFSSASCWRIRCSEICLSSGPTRNSLTKHMRHPAPPEQYRYSSPLQRKLTERTSEST